MIEEGVDLEKTQARILLELGDDVEHFVGNFDRVGVTLLEDHHHDRRLGVDAHPIKYLGHFVAHHGDVFEPHGRTDHTVLKRLDIAIFGHRTQQKLFLAGEDVSAREREVVVAELLAELPDVEPGGGDSSSIELDQDFALLQTAGVDIGDPVDPFQGEDDLVLDQIVGIHHRIVDPKAHESNGDGVVVVFLDQHPVDVVGHARLGAFDAVAYLAVGHIHVGADLEAQEARAETGLGVGEDVLQPGNRGELLFERQGDLVENLLRRRLIPDHTHAEGRVVVAARDQLQRNAESGDDADHHGGEQDHQHRHTAIEGKAGQDEFSFVVAHGLNTTKKGARLHGVLSEHVKARGEPRAFFRRLWGAASDKYRDQHLLVHRRMVVFAPW